MAEWGGEVGLLGTLCLWWSSHDPVDTGGVGYPDRPVIAVLLASLTCSFVPAVTETKVLEQAFSTSCYPACDMGLRSPLSHLELVHPRGPRGF